MAIDTENKRRSVQAYLLGLVRPVADGAITSPDRATVGWFYSGLAYAGVVAVVTLYYLRRRRMAGACSRLQR